MRTPETSAKATIIAIALRFMLLANKKLSDSRRE
jgi:hypothetical protein